MKRILSAIALLVSACLPAPAQICLLTDSSGALLQPADFFTINSNLIVQAIGGAFSSGGGGTNSSRLFWGGVQVDDPNFVSSATVSRVAASSVTNLAFQVVDGSITSNKLASATITPDKLTSLTSADLRGKVSDGSGTGVLLFQGGVLGAATATTQAANDNDTSVATTAWYQTEESELIALRLWQGTNAVLTQHALGNLSGGTNLNATTAFSSGVVPIARLATGTPNGSQFIRDDGTLATPAGGGDVTGPASSTDSVVALYNGTTGKILKNGTLTEASIATDAEVAAGYQPLDADLTDLADGSLTGSKVGTGISGDNVTTGTVADARIAATIARLASPTFTGTVIGPTASASSSNTVLATTAYVDRAVAGVSAGGGGNASTNVAQGWSADQTFTNIVVTGSATMGDLSVASISPATAIPIIHGGSGATTAAGARTNFGLIIGGDVQAYSARLTEVANISYSTGDLIYYNGSALVRMPIGTNGQVLGVSAGALAYINQTGSGGGGTTNLSGLTGDVSLGTLADGQYLGYNSTASKWTNRTPATNPLLVNWIGAYGIGTRTNFATSTNILIGSFSVPPTADPGANGRYIVGNASMLLTNDTAVSDSFDFRIVASGVTVVDATKVVSAALFENYTFNFRVVRESDTSASIYADGVGIISSSTANIGIGTFGGQVRDFISVATNVAWTWANTNSLELYVGLRNTGGGATTFGVTRLSAGLYSLQDNAAIISDTAFGSGFNGVTNIAVSKNAFYDWAHIGDIDDDGFPNVLDTGATGVTASANSSNTVVATTAYVDRAVASGTGSAANIPPLHDEFIFYDASTGYAQFPWNNQNNAGGTVTIGASETNAPGVLDFGITTSGSSRATLEAKGTDALMLGDGIEWNMEFRTKVSALSDATDTYIIRCGFLDTRPDVDSTDCVGIRYTHGVNSGKYEFVCRSNSTESTADSGLTPSTTAFQTFRIRVDSTSANAYLYTNGVLAATITSANIPKGTARAVSPGMFGITRTAGTTTARTMKMDYYDLRPTGVTR